MTRILMLGDSHLAAMKLGFDTMRPAYADLDVTFIGLRGRHANAIVVRQGKIWIDDPEAREKVFSTAGQFTEPLPVTGFQHVFLVGMGLNIFRIFALYRNYRADDHHYQDDGNFLVSPACFQKSCEGLLKQAKALRLAEAIVRQTQVPVGICPQPLPSRYIVSDLEYAHVAAAVTAMDDLSLARSYNSAIAALSVPGATVHAQPEETIEPPMFTKEAFCQGSVRLTQNLDRPHPSGDHAHMNAAYGSLVLKQLFAGLKLAPAA